MADYFEKVLTDGWENIYVEDYRLSSESLIGYVGPAWHISKYTLKGGKQHGVDMVEIDNGHLTVVVVPTRGMNVLEAFTDETVLGWDSPVRQVVHPLYVDVESRGGLGWLAGFNELVARCGLSSHGAPGPDLVRTNTGAEAEVVLPLHGTIANTPAVRVAVWVQLQPPYELSVVGEVLDTQMFGAGFRLLTSISTVPGASEFTVSDTVQNLGASPCDMELLYHCNYGRPMLGEGARLVAPVEFCCPRDARAAEDTDTWDTYAAAQQGYAEQCYFLRVHADDDGRTAVALVDADEKRAASIRYSVEQLPAFTLWKNTAAERDGYVTGLEPGTDYPNPRRFEREKGRVVTLQGEETYEASLTFGLVSGAEAVGELKEEIAALADGKESDVRTEPDPDYCTT
jgi:hypothetical protein